MAAADDVLTLDRAFAERAAAVRAAVVDGEQLLAVAQQKDGGVIDDNAHGLPVSQLRRAGGRGPFLRPGVIDRLCGSDALGEREVAAEIAAEHQGASAAETEDRRATAARKRRRVEHQGRGI